METNNAYQALLRATRLSDEIIVQVQQRYRESLRAYHAEGHLKRIAQYAVDHRISLTWAQAIAILFHDAVYIPFADPGMNEALSAKLLRVMLAKSDVPQYVILVAEQIILDTARHIPTIADSALVQDLDLLGLADDYESLQEDSRLVYQEFQPLVGDWEQYEVKRMEFFAGMLRQPRVLHSEELGHLEGRLRANLNRAINEYKGSEGS